MDTGLNNSRGVNSRRNDRLSKQDRKFNQSRASKIKAKYRTALKSEKPLSESSIMALRARITTQERRRIKRQWIIVLSLGILIILLIAFLMNY